MSKIQQDPSGATTKASAGQNTASGMFSDSLSEAAPQAKPLGKTKPRLVLHKTVALVGMMGAGKTSVGRAIAAHLHVPFLDSDREIEAASNLSISALFERFGEPFFREKETQIISRLMKNERAILSTGGGAFLSEKNRDIIRENGIAVWLDADLDLLWDRVRHKDTRPLLRTEDPYRTLGDIYRARVPSYARADLSVKAQAGLSLQEMAERVIAKLAQERPDILETIDD